MEKSKLSASNHILSSVQCMVGESNYKTL